MKKKLGTNKLFCNRKTSTGRGSQDSSSEAWGGHGYRESCSDGSGCSGSRCSAVQQKEEKDLRKDSTTQ